MRTRILEPEEHARLLDVADGPFAGRPEVVEQLGPASRVIVVEDEAGDIQAYWPIWVAVHLEPLWIAERQRRNPAVVGPLVTAMQAQLEAEGITTAFAVIGYADTMTHVPMAGRLGFDRVPGDLYFLRRTPQAEERDGSSGSTGDQPRGAVLYEPGQEQAGGAGAAELDGGPPAFGG